MPPHQNRQITQDIAKALAIFAVVYGHVWRGLVRADVFPADHPLQILDYAIYTWHMPLFFMLAGYNAASGLSRAQPKQFFLKRAGTILPIYFGWSLLQGLLQALKGHSATLSVAGHLPPDSINFFDLPLIIYKPIDQFWFLYALIAYHLFAALTYKRSSIFLGLAVIAFVLNGFGNTLFREELLYHAIFYVGGLYLARIPLSRFDDIEAWKATVVSIVLYLSFLVIGCMTGMETTNPLMLPATIGGLGLVMAISRILSRTRSRDALAFAGAASLAIYVTHVFFTASWRTVLLKAHIENGYIHLLSGTIIGITGPLVLYAVLKRFRLLRYSLLG